MNRRTLVLLVTIAVVIVALIAGYTLLRPMLENASDVTSASTSGSHSGQEPHADGDKTSPAASAGSYIDYTPTAIEESEGTTLLFFHASWCPSCRQIDAEITSSGLPNGVTVIKVDYDSHQDLRQKYGVTVQTTFVKVDSSGTELAKFVPYGGDLGLDLVLDELT